MEKTSSHRNFDRYFPIPTPENHGRRLNRNPFESSIQSPFFIETDSDRTLEVEAAFSRLNLSVYPRQLSCLSMFGNSENDYSIDGEGLWPFSLQETEQTNRELQRLGLQNNGFSTMGHMGLQDHGHFLQQNGFLRDLAVDSCGVIGGVVSKSSSILRSGLHNPRAQQQPLNYVCLEDLRGRIVSMAMDQYGCRFLQMKFEDIKEEEIGIVFSEVIGHVGELMIDQFGNYLVQKLVEACSEEQRTQILLSVTKNKFQLVSICLNMHGTRAVQKLLEHLTTPQQISLVMSALSPGAVALTKDMNGHHVIQHCLKHFSNEDNKYLLNEVADNCFGIATDKSGCCVLQSCVESSQGETRERLVAEIIANALLLAEDRYGNYVVQHILGLKLPRVTANLLRQLEGNYFSLSCNKYGSNVVEKCLIESGEEHSGQIIMELLRSPNVSMLLLDPYGNYVIQSALSASKGFIHSALVKLVQTHSLSMRSNLYGKKVLAWFDRKKLCNIYRNIQK